MSFPSERHEAMAPVKSEGSPAPEFPVPELPRRYQPRKKNHSQRGMGNPSAQRNVAQLTQGKRTQEGPASNSARRAKLARRKNAKQWGGEANEDSKVNGDVQARLNSIHESLASLRQLVEGAVERLNQQDQDAAHRADTIAKRDLAIAKQEQTIARGSKTIALQDRIVTSNHEIIDQQHQAITRNFETYAQGTSGQVMNGRIVY